MTSIQNTPDVPRRRRPITVATSLICLLAAGAGAAIWVSPWIGVSAAKSAVAKDTSVVQAVPVQVEKPQIENVPVYLEGLGTVQAFNTVEIKTRVDGELQSVLFTEGQEVKKGDLLAVIDPRPYQAAVDQATAKIQQDEANLANAQYLLSKDQKLAKQEIATEETLETQQTQVVGLNAQLAEDQAAKEAASVSLSYTEVRSPIDGRTGLRFVDVGNQVHTTDPTGIVTITQTRPISVVSTLPEDDLAAVRDAMKAGPVTVAAISMDQSTVIATGTLSLIDNEIDQTNGTMRIKSTFPNADGALWPGQFVKLRVQQKVLAGAVTIPSSALQRGPDGYFVYVVGNGDTAAVRKVTPGPIAAGRAAVMSGLSETESVITAGQYRLQPGTPISSSTPPSSTTAQKE